VVSRLFAISQPLPAARAPIRAAADAITPEARAGDFAQAMMDLGATICTAKRPRCLLCPLSAECAAFARGDPEVFPVKPPRSAKPARHGHAFWIERDGAVWLVRRRPSGMLGGMRALPDDGWSARGNGSGAPPLAGAWRPGGAVSHAFTHFSLTLDLLVYSSVDGVTLPGSDGEWWPIARLDEAGLPTLFARAAQLALADRETDA
jgi:A/G-specific adenine glycosylase